MGIANLSRGTDAHGFAYFESNNLRIYKGKGDITNTFRSMPWQDFQMPKVFIGHTRFAIKGDPEFGRNNHPLVTKDFAVVHNGHICNDDALSMVYDLNRKAEVDTEVIVAMFQKFKEVDLSADTMTLVKLVTQKLAGTHSCALLDRNASNGLILWRMINPLYLAQVPELDAIFFSSLYFNLKTLFKRFDKTMIGGMKTGKIASLRIENNEIKVEKDSFKPFGCSELPYADSEAANFHIEQGAIL